MQAISPDPADTAAVDLARECLYRFLAAALTDPRSKGFRPVLDADNQRLAAAAADLLREEALREPVPPGFGELPAEDLDLGPVLAELGRPREELEAAFDQAFGLVYCRECPPYETEYCPNTEPFFRAQQLADVAGFYHAYGLTPSQATPERPDHLALELEFLALLLLKRRLAADGTDEAGVCEETMRHFFGDHVAWWVPAFASGLRRKAGRGSYAAVGRVLAALLPAERRRLGVPAPRLPMQPVLIERPEEQAGCGGCTASA